MGSSLSTLIKSIDGSDDAAKQIEESLNALFALGESRNDAAWARATANDSKVYAPISKVLLRRQSIVASATINNKDGVVGGIKGAVGNLMNGQILDGVTDIISSAMDVVLGASSGQVSSQYTYALIATSLGALLRIDVDIYSFELRSKGLQEKAKNMTAVTSIISTVDATSLTLGDIRGIVSLSFGGSPEDRQKAIFEVVKAAWENDRKFGLGPSVYETNLRSTEPPQDLPSKPRVTQDTLKQTFKTYASQRQLSARTGTISGIESLANGVPGRSNGRDIASRSGRAKSSPAGKNADPMVDVFLWVMVTTQVDETWISQMGGAISGFNVAGMIQYIGVNSGLSGNAVTLRIKVNSNRQCFDLCIQYLNDTVLYQIAHAEYLASIISTMALQFDHPSDGHRGLVTLVEYSMNRITNKTPDVILFFNGATQIMSIAPGGQGIIDGTVSHLVGQRQSQNEGGGTDGEIPNGEDAAGRAPQTPSLSTQCVTYDSKPNIVRKVEMELHRASEYFNSGYLLLTNDGYNHDTCVAYTVAWPEDADVAS